jgi:hypothetical protein
LPQQNRADFIRFAEEQPLPEMWAAISQPRQEPLPLEAVNRSKSGSQ